MGRIHRIGNSIAIIVVDLDFPSERLNQIHRLESVIPGEFPEFPR